MRPPCALLLATLLAWGCARSPAAQDGVPPPTRTATLLPAHRTAHDLPAKADTADPDAEQRLALPSLYAVTVPPARPHRAVREWEPMAMLLAAWPAYMPEEQEVRETMLAMLGHTVRDAATDVGILASSQTARQDVVAGLLAFGLTEAEVGARVHFYDVPVDSIWIVDYGPIPIVDDRATVAFADLRYYKSRVLDDAVPSRLALLGPEAGSPSLRTTAFRAPLSAEGGNLQADGDGTCYTTTRLLATTGSTAAELLGTLRAYLGCEQLVVLHDIADDATGHVDMFFKLVAPDHAVLGRHDPRAGEDPVNAARMDANAAILLAVVLPSGGSPTVSRMPFPSKSKGIPRTFVNATLVNGVNLWPVYEDDGAGGVLEAQAAAAWEAALPGYMHVGIRSDRLASYSGAIHCISRTIPALPVAPWVEDGSCEGGLCVGPEGGYADLCQHDGDCTGAALQCLCPVCNSSCAPSACGDVPPAGLCAGATAIRCDGGTLVEQECGGCCATGPDGAACSGTCPPACDDACAEGEVGCDGAEHAWSCDRIDGCWRRVYSWCGGPSCEGGGCVGCGGLGAAGCCAADGAAVVRCDGGSTVEIPCAAGTACGWDPAGFYACLPEGRGAGSDPTSAHPRTCPATCVDTCALGETGCSDETARWTCIEGDGGCLTRARSPCAAGSKCQDGACIRPAFPVEATQHATPPAQVAATAPPSGCRSGGGPAPTAALLLLLALVARRRRHA